MPGILHGVTVLDFGRYIAAPFCCQLLADLGADVIRVERPGGEADRQRGPWTATGESLYFAAINRNKRAITLNVRHKKGAELLAGLVASSDVLVHNLPLSRAQSLGLDYPAMQGRNPKLVYLAISGFGATGPRANDPALDAVFQAMSGGTATNGAAGQPPIPSHIPYVDFSTGLYGALSIVSALYHRKSTGVGQMIDLALYNTALSFVVGYGLLAEFTHNGVARQHVGADFIYAAGGMYQASDGYITVNCVTNAMFESLCKVIARPDLAQDPRLQGDGPRDQHRDVINAAIAPWVAQRTSQEAVETLAKGGVPAGPVQSVAALPTDPQAQAAGSIQQVEQPGIGQVPVAPFVPRMEGSSPIARPAPGVGQHNAEAYKALLGLDEDQLTQLAAEGAL